MTIVALSTLAKSISAVRPKKVVRAALEARPDLGIGEFAAVRSFGDGTVEFQDCHGRLRRGRYVECVECERNLPNFCFTLHIDSYAVGRPGLCGDCCERYREYRPSRAEMLDAEARKRAIEALQNATEKRSASLTLAKAKWRDGRKISEVYQKARQLTVETGVPHHVDHFYPLQGQFCCGLHVHENLRVMPATANCSKNNGHPMDQSPALVAMIDQYGLAGLKTWLLWAQRVAGIAH